MSEQTTCNNKQKLVLVWGGKRGWIGQQLVDMINEREGWCARSAMMRMEDREAVGIELDLTKPDRVICAAGTTGRPNVDYLESHKDEAVRNNVIGLLNLADLTNERKIPLLNMSTGCIYEYETKGEGAHTLGSGIGFTETDEPNFTASWYSKTKALVEPILMGAFPLVCTLRLRMPISDDLSPRSFVTKITKYERVVNVPNSMSVLYDLLPVAVDMCMRGDTGIYNFVNPGVISHNEILAMYKQYIDPSFQWTNFSLEEQDKILKAKRSNNELDASKLVAANPERTIPHIKDAVQLCFQRMQRNLKK